MRLRSQPTSSRVEINMTPMIDVVFQLLAFFVMSFKIVSAEGDLALKLPVEPSEQWIVSDRFVPPLSVQLLSDASGELAAIKLGDRSLRDLSELRHEVEVAIASDPQQADELRVDLICDDVLHYHHVVAALTAVSGRRDEAGVILPLASNVHLLRPTR